MGSVPKSRLSEVFTLRVVMSSGEALFRWLALAAAAHAGCVADLVALVGTSRVYT